MCLAQETKHLLDYRIYGYKNFTGSILCVWMFHPHICLSTMYMQCSRKSEDVARFLDTGVTDDGE